jgi:hypothetical protein
MRFSEVRLEHCTPSLEAMTDHEHRNLRHPSSFGIRWM